MSRKPAAEPGDTRQRVRWMIDRAALCLSVAPLAWAVFGAEFGRPIVTWAIAAALVLAFRSLWLSWKTLAGTALRPATIWGMLAVACAFVAIAASDADTPGRPRQGLFVHLTFLAVLAALVSVLGARKPGESAWAILCGLFLLIGLLPMLEGIGLAKRFDTLDRLRLESPWSYFFVLVIIAGAGNYLPTRFGLPALILGIGLASHLRLLWKPEGRAEWRGDHWFILPWALAVAVAVGAILSRRSRRFEAPTAFHEVWIPFRDAWGAAWALRVLERVNQTAIRNAWPERLTWFGLVDSEKMRSSDADANNEPNERPAVASNPVESAEFPNAASLTATLAVFLKRFGDAGVIRRL